MRRVIAVMLLLGACGKTGTAPEEQGESIACALGGSQQFKPQCTVERDGKNIVVRLPDGGFHRFVFSQDGKRLEAADGSEQASSVRQETALLVALGQDRYLIPIKADAR